jgi:pilus assembly protein CpaF
MFSKYKKPGDVAVATPAPKAKAPAPQQQPEEAVAPKPASMRRVAQAATVAPQDRDVKRKQRMSDIKLELHRALLENLNRICAARSTKSRPRFWPRNPSC